MNSIKVPENVFKHDILNFPIKHSCCTYCAANTPCVDTFYYVKTVTKVYLK